jgi:hypothetical protein
MCVCVQVIKVYIIDYTRDCMADLRSRPLHQSIRMYMICECWHVHISVEAPLSCPALPPSDSTQAHELVPVVVQSHAVERSRCVQLICNYPWMRAPPSPLCFKARAPLPPCFLFTKDV